MVMRIPICKKKKKTRGKEEGKNMIPTGERGAVEKKSGGGQPDLSGAGSREWVSSLKGPSSTREKKMPP